MRPPEPQDWHEEKTYESMITYGSGAIKFVLFANGGAIVSLMTFLGNNGEKAHDLSSALYCFIAGVGVGGFTNVTAYITQLALFNERQPSVSWYWRHTSWLYLTMGLIIIGILFFLIGAILAASIFS